jgi:hypothetical protein
MNPERLDYFKRRANGSDLVAAETEELIEAIESLQARANAMARYARHTDTCSKQPGNNFACDCGLDEILRDESSINKKET